jgi:hypothetical protein
VISALNQLAPGLLSTSPDTYNYGAPVLRLTLLVSAIASATFAATLAFAPGVLDLGERVLAAQTRGTSVVSVQAEQIRQCGAFAKIIDALSHGGECP